MCDPVTAIAVGSAVTGIVQQQQAASFENEYQRYTYGETVKSANAAAAEEYFNLSQRSRQEEARAAQAVQQLTGQARAATSQAVLQAAETGTRGRSVQALLREFEQTETEIRTTEATNLDNLRAQVEAEKRATAARRQERIVSALPRPVQGPLDSPIGILHSGLSVGSAGYSAYKSTRPPGAF